MFPLGAKRQLERHASVPETDPATTPLQLPVVVLLGEGPGTATVIDEPVYRAGETACRCGGCHAAHPPDLASLFLNERAGA
jgi:hypothetical protein